jgi:hypothetical protein
MWRLLNPYITVGHSILGLNILHILDANRKRLIKSGHLPEPDWVGATVQDGDAKVLEVPGYRARGFCRFVRLQSTHFRH